MAVSAFYLKDLAATYSRASYTGTTIGKAVFDGRVRDGIGSDHSFMATKNWSQNFAAWIPEDPAMRLTKCKRTLVP